MIGQAIEKIDIDTIPRLGSIWEHIENGNRYSICLITNLNCENKKFIPTVVYRNMKTQVIYSRPLSEWRLRFIDVTSLHTFELAS